MRHWYIYRAVIASVQVTNGFGEMLQNIITIKSNEIVKHVDWLSLIILQNAVVLFFLHLY